MGPSTKHREPLEWEGNIIPFFILGLILLLLGPGLIIGSIGIFIDEGAEFSLFGEYGPEDPQFVGDVIWEGTTDDAWTAKLFNDGGELRVWIEEGKSIDLSVSLYGDRSGADFYRCEAWECDYFNNANESIPGYEFIGTIEVWKNSTYTVQFTSTEENNATVMVIVTQEIFPIPGIALVGMMFVGVTVTYIIIKFAYHSTQEIREEAENNNGNRESVSKNNWIGPDGTESGPDVPEDWYLTYDGPAPIVEDIYDENYVVDRGNGTVPVDFYIKKWGVPEGFGETDHEKLWSWND